MSRPRLLFTHPFLSPPGGGNALAAWMLQALLRSEEYEVTVLTVERCRASLLDEAWGTSLSGHRFPWFRLEDWERKVIRRLGFGLLTHHLLLRKCQRLAPSFDLAVGGYNEADFGIPGVQYINFPTYLHPRPEANPLWYSQPLLLAPLRGYYTACRRLSGHREEAMLANLTLVNSHWTAERVREAYGDRLPCRVLYPPALGQFAPLTWERKEDGFVVVGRLAPEKQVHEILDILGAVRERGHDVRCHVVGGPGCRTYAASIEKRAESLPWVRLHLNIGRAALVDLVCSQRFGIHGKPQEHFGLAVAEMVRGGCVAFVRGDGGPEEIVGRDPRLIFHDARDAVDKIDGVLKEPALQRELAARLGSRAGTFTVESFMDEFCCRIREWRGATRGSGAEFHSP